MQNDSNEGPNPSGYCMCGCGQRTRLAPQTRAARGWVKGKPVRYIGSHRPTDHVQLANTSELCMCGCGEKAPIAKVTRVGRGWIKGKPKPFVRGHDKRGFVVSKETREKISAATRGKERPKREQATGWKGGTKMLRGRLMVNVGLDHPMTKTQVYVMAHRLVASEVVGRPLESHEHVHHVNLDPNDNAPDNLALLSNSQHQRLHRMVESGTDALEALRIVGGVRLTDAIPPAAQSGQDAL